MLEVIKNKMMIGAALILLGVVFMGASITNKLEEKNEQVYENMIAMNIQ